MTTRIAIGAATLALLALSQTPVPSGGKGESHQPQSQPATANTKPDDYPRGTDKAPIVVKVQPPAKTNEEAAKEKHKEDREASTYRWSVASTITAGIVGLLTLLMIGIQARIAHRQNRIMLTQNTILTDQKTAAATSAKAAADAVVLTEKQQTILEQQHAAILKQAEHMESGLTLTRDALKVSQDNADAAKTNADAAIASARTAEATLATNREIERAYVVLSHKPPGVNIAKTAVTLSGPEPVPMKDVSINLTVRNFGNTPAQVTAFLFHFMASNEELPVDPPYDHSRAQTLRMSLVKGDHATFSVNTPMQVVAVEQIKNGSMTLYALGYIDYIDKFGTRHRSAYGRVYNPSIDHHIYKKDSQFAGPLFGKRVSLPVRLAMGIDDEAWRRRSNLPFVTQAGYNYDRERKEGEGNDWDKPTQQKPQP